jgi:hypothetical protein
LIGTLPQSFAQIDTLGIQPTLELAPTVLVSTTPPRLDRPPRV